MDSEGIHTFKIKVKELEGIFQEFNLCINMSNSRPFVIDDQSDKLSVVGTDGSFVFQIFKKILNSGKKHTVLIYPQPFLSVQYHSVNYIHTVV